MSSAHVRDLIGVLTTQRQNCEEECSTIFEKASEQLGDLGVTVQLPRIAKVQRYRSNFPNQTPQFIPMLDSIIMDLQSRFCAATINSCTLAQLLPEFIHKTTIDLPTIKQFCTTYGNLLNKDINYLEIILGAEIKMWSEKWKNVDEPANIPKLPEDVLQSCDADVFPYLDQLLLIFTTLPISVATAERSFSSLRRLKTYLQSNILQNRLSGLALLHIHRDITINVNKVIVRFSKFGNHKLEFVI